MRWKLRVVGLRLRRQLRGSTPGPAWASISESASWIGSLPELFEPDDFRTYVRLNDYNGLCRERVVCQSRSLRHLPLRNGSPDPATAGFFRYIQGLCGRGCSPASVLRGPKAFSTDRYSPDLLTAAVSVNSFNALLLRSFVDW